MARAEATELGTKKQFVRREDRRRGWTLRNWSRPKAFWEVNGDLPK